MATKTDIVSRVFTRDAPAYRTIVFKSNGAFHKIIPIIAKTDEIAMTAAQYLANGGTADLWDGLRFIEQFEHQSGTELY